MNTALWIAQGILGAMFIMAGIMKSTQAKEKLAKRLPWVNDFSPLQVKLIGFAELLGGLGLILPWYTGIEPILTPIAAIGLGLTMLFAALYHFNKKEYKEIGINLVLLSIAVFIAYGRF